MLTCESQSIQEKSLEASKNALSETAENDFSPTLTIVFLSINRDRKAICKILEAKGIAIFGAIANCELSAYGIESYGIVILLIDTSPFFTTKPTGSGTGLGLSLSYDIVKAHGGEIRVKSQVGEVGTEFIINIPFKSIQ